MRVPHSLTPAELEVLPIAQQAAYYELDEDELIEWRRLGSIQNERGMDALNPYQRSFLNSIALHIVRNLHKRRGVSNSDFMRRHRPADRSMQVVPLHPQDREVPEVRTAPGNVDDETFLIG